MGWDTMDSFGCSDAGTRISQNQSVSKSAEDLVMENCSEGSSERQESSDASMTPSTPRRGLVNADRLASTPEKGTQVDRLATQIGAQTPHRSEVSS